VRTEPDLRRDHASMSRHRTSVHRNTLSIFARQPSIIDYITRQSAENVVCVVGSTIHLRRLMRIPWLCSGQLHLEVGVGSPHLEPQRIGRSGKAPAVPPVHELHRDDQRDGQRQLGPAVSRAAVRVSAELSEVREPRVGALDWPAKSEGDDLACLANPWPGVGPPLRTDHIIESVRDAEGADRRDG
jgi:hypothetical protein